MRSVTRLARPLILASLSTLMLASLAHATEETLRPGKWEVITTGTMDQAGEKMDLPESRSDMCVLPPDKAAVTPTDTTCQFETLEKSSGKLVTRASCGDIVTDTSMTWNDDAYETITHMVMTSGGATVMVTDMKVAGRYLGACEG